MNRGFFNARFVAAIALAAAFGTVAADGLRSPTNTASLDTAQPDPRLNDTRVPVRTYSLPPASNQKAGPVPLRECLNDDTCAPNVLARA